MFSPWRRLAQAIGLAVPGGRVEHLPFDRRSTEVLARVAHEARQPLAAARAAFELIRHSPDNARRERACVVLDKQLVRLTRLFDDLLEASRLRFAATILRVERVDLCRLVEEVVESVRPQAAERHQRLDACLPEHPVWMQGDSVRLQQVVSNLLVNGIRYTGPGGRISVELSHDMGDAVLTVSDTGQGIAADLLPHVFEPFTRGEGGTEQGLGVGLAIARQLVELHGGTICASSAGPGNGSEFVVILPTRVPGLIRQQIGETAAAVSTNRQPPPP